MSTQRRKYKVWRLILIKKRVRRIEQAAVFITVLMACKQAVPQAVRMLTLCPGLCLLFVCRRMRFFVRKGQHPHVMMQRPMRKAQALPQRQTQQHRRQRNTLNEAEARNGNLALHRKGGFTSPRQLR